MGRFSQFYEELYGERWPALYLALSRPPGHRELSDGLVQPYYLDPASYAVAGLLPIDGAGAILDLCAAPGGKALVLATGMAPGARLVTNERSATRRERLRRVLADHLTGERLRQVTVTGHDARKWGMHEPGAYDAVLADVPCSSERHLIRNAGDADRWNPRRSRQLAIDQFAILAAAIDSCRIGGWILYATCTLSPMENDAVIAKALKKRSVRLVAIGSPDRPVAGSEPTEHGIAILPDRAAGAGPMYASLLQKQ